MSSSNLSRNIIFIIVFLGSFYLLIALVSIGFTYAGTDYERYTYPDEFSKTDIEQLKFYDDVNITVGIGSWQGLDFTPQGASFVFRIYFEEAVFGYPRRVFVTHMNPFFFWFWTPENMVYDEGGVEYGLYLDKTEVLSRLDSEINASRFSNTHCPHITVSMFLRDPNNTRSSLSDAWDDGTINVMLAFGFDDFSVQLSAWDIIGQC